jgi:hypothetical protein
MRKKTLMKTIITATAAGAIVLTIGGFAFAEGTVDTVKVSGNTVINENFGRSLRGRGYGLGSDYKKLVEDKIISQEQADKISAFIKQKHEEKKAERDKLKSMTKEEKSAYLK